MDRPFIREVETEVLPDLEDPVVGHHPVGRTLNPASRRILHGRMPEATDRVHPTILPVSIF